MDLNKNENSKNNNQSDSSENKSKNSFLKREELPLDMIPDEVPRKDGPGGEGK